MRDDAKIVGAVRWLGIGAAGLFGGALLGGFTVGDSLHPAIERDFSFAEYSGNPDALTVDYIPVEPCYSCADSYRVSERLNAARMERTDGAFRQLGAIAVDHSSPDDGYRYGGNFEDPRAAVVKVELQSMPQSDAQEAGNAPPLVQAAITPQIDPNRVRDTTKP